MRKLYKAFSGPPDTPLVIDIMRNAGTLFDEAGVAKSLPPLAKTLALGIMQITNSFGLTDIILRRIEHDRKDVWGAETNGVDHYLKVLSGQIMCMVDDECPALITGEWWWIDAKQDAIIINKSGEDALLLYVTVKAKWDE